MATGWLDNAQRYGLVTRALHWAMAGLLLWQFVGMGLRLALGRTPLVTFFVGSHASLGAVLFVLALARILWGLLNRSRRPIYEPGLLGRAAKAGHIALYSLMVIVPSLALLRAWGGERAFAPFGIPVFPAREAAITWATAPANALHGVLAWVLLLLIAGHVAMVFVHQFILRDDTAQRMIHGAGAAR